MSPRTLVIVGIVFVLLSAATTVWQWPRGETASSQLGVLSGGLIVLVFGLYLVRRDRS